MVELITILIGAGLEKIFYYLMDNWHWIILNIVVYIVAFIWLCEIVDKAEKSRMRKWGAEEDRFKRIEDLLKKIIEIQDRNISI